MTAHLRLKAFSGPDLLWRGTLRIPHGILGLCRRLEVRTPARFRVWLLLEVVEGQ